MSSTAHDLAVRPRRSPAAPVGRGTARGTCGEDTAARRAPSSRHCRARSASPTSRSAAIPPISPHRAWQGLPGSSSAAACSASSAVRTRPPRPSAACSAATPPSSSRSPPAAAAAVGQMLGPFALAMHELRAGPRARAARSRRSGSWWKLAQPALDAPARALLDRAARRPKTRSPARPDSAGRQRGSARARDLRTRCTTRSRGGAARLRGRRRCGPAPRAATRSADDRCGSRSPVRSSATSRKPARVRREMTAAESERSSTRSQAGAVSTSRMTLLRTNDRSSVDSPARSSFRR